MTLRNLAEHTCAHVHTLIYDYEGEFTTLREKHDLVLVGDGGEVPCDPRTAAVLTRRLMEHSISAIFDLSSLDLSQRRAFVRQSVQALMAMPRTHWHQTLIILDEAHMFCPERSAGDAESTQAVIALLSQGRKRGFCGVLATQRITKLHKDAVAECNNIFIGRTWLDIDQKRAADILGISSKDRNELKALKPGEFYGYGPALNANGIVRFLAKQGKTTHPEAGQRHKMTPPAPSANIKRILPELADLAQKSEDQPINLEEANKVIAKQRQQIKQLEKASPAPVIDEAAIEARIAQAVEIQTKHMRELKMGLNHRVVTIRTRLEELVVMASDASHIMETALTEVSTQPGSHVTRPAQSSVVRTQKEAAPSRVSAGGSGDQLLGKCERAILQVLATHLKPMSKQAVGIISGYSPKSGGFNNSLSKLRTAQYVNGTGDAIEITQAGVNAVGAYEPLPTGEALHRWWIGKLPKAEGIILQSLIQMHPHGLTKEGLGAITGYSWTSGGFNNALSKLRTLTLIDGYKEIKASPALFD